MSVRLFEFPKRHISGPRELLPVTAIIWVVAYAGMELPRQFGGLPTIWPTDGIMVAILLGVKVQAWPAYIVAGFAGNVGAMLMLQYPADLAFEFPFANFSGIIFIAVLLRQHVTVVSDLYKLHASLRFMFLAAGAAPLLAASLKVLLLYFDHINASLAFFIADFLSHSLGLMTVTPFALALRGAGIVTFTRHRLSTPVGFQASVAEQK